MQIETRISQLRSGFFIADLLLKKAEALGCLGSFLQLHMLVSRVGYHRATGV